MKKLFILPSGLLMTIRPFITLKSMREEDFSIFYHLVTKEYAKGLHINKYNQFSLQEAEQYAHKQINNFLPNGIHSSGQSLRNIVSVKDNVETIIGFVWYEPHSAHLPGNPTWLHYVYINEDQRGKGYGHATLQLLENELKMLGEKHIGLSVFGNNTIAQKLYLSAGYQIIEEKRTEENKISYWKMAKVII